MLKYTEQCFEHSATVFMNGLFLRIYCLSTLSLDEEYNIYDITHTTFKTQKIFKIILWERKKVAKKNLPYF